MTGKVHAFINVIVAISRNKLIFTVNILFFFDMELIVSLHEVISSSIITLAIVLVLPVVAVSFFVNNCHSISAHS